MKKNYLLKSCIAVSSKAISGYEFNKIESTESAKLPLQHDVYQQQTSTLANDDFHPKPKTSCLQICK